MINSSDLRLGNKVLDLERGEVATVIGIEPDRVQLKPSPYIWTTCDKIKGVKISDEWLKSYGFDDKEYKDGYVGVVVETGNGLNTDFALTKPGYLGKFQTHYAWEYKQGNWPFYNSLEFLHDLQNFFYAITGTELKIKV